MPTYGETLVADLLKTLPVGEYFSIVEPHISTKESAYRNPDVVIVSNKLGVIVMEIKDWKNIKRIDKDSMIIERSNGEIATERNPVWIAREYSFNLVERFEKIDALFKKNRGKKNLVFPWTHTVVLPHTEARVLRECEDKGIWEEGRVLGKQDLTPEHFKEALQNLPWERKTAFSIDMKILDTIRGVLDPFIIIDDEEGIPTGILTVIQEAEITRPLSSKSTSSQLPLFDDLMTQEAEEIVEATSVRLVRGVAGSGKSLVLARRAQFLAEEHPDLHILVMAFNKDLTADLRRRIPGAPNLEVSNFHKVCKNIIGNKWKSPFELEGWLNNRVASEIQQNRLTPEFVHDEIAWRKELEIYDDTQYLEMNREGRGRPLSKPKRVVINTIFNQYNQYHHQMRQFDWSDVSRMALNELQQGHPLRHAYDVILIDEAQDFAPSWIQVVKRLLKPNGSMFMCDDPTQSLFRSFSWKQKGIEVVGKTRVLQVPFRCTREITAVAYSLIDADKALNQSEEITKPDLTTYDLNSGDLPLLVKCRDLMDEIGYVERSAKAAIASGTPGNQIAILCHNKRLIKHWAHLRNQGIYVASFNQMKGLEFQTVFLPNLHTVFDEANTEKEDEFISESRRRIFTAITRARTQLVLSHHGNSLPVELWPIRQYVRQENAVSYNK
jgi:hypothetical protein